MLGERSWQRGGSAGSRSHATSSRGAAGGTASASQQLQKELAIRFSGSVSDDDDAPDVAPCFWSAHISLPPMGAPQLEAEAPVKPSILLLPRVPELPEEMAPPASASQLGSQAAWSDVGLSAMPTMTSPQGSPIPARPEDKLDGWWRTAGQEDVCITGYRLQWPRGPTGTIRRKAEAKIEAVIANQEFSAWLVGGKLQWSDGDCWTRIEDTLLGSWRTSRGDNAMIDEEWVTWPRGSRGSIISRGTQKLLVCVDGDSYEAQHSNGKLVWSDGDEWTRVQADRKTYDNWLASLGMANRTPIHSLDRCREEHRGGSQRSAPPVATMASHLSRSPLALSSRDGLQDLRPV